VNRNGPWKVPKLSTKGKGFLGRKDQSGRLAIYSRPEIGKFVEKAMRKKMGGNTIDPGRRFYRGLEATVGTGKFGLRLRGVGESYIKREGGIVKVDDPNKGDGKLHRKEEFSFC